METGKSKDLRDGQGKSVGKAMGSELQGRRDLESRRQQGLMGEKTIACDLREAWLCEHKQSTRQRGFLNCPVMSQLQEPRQVSSPLWLSYSAVKSGR